MNSKFVKIPLSSKRRKTWKSHACVFFHCKKEFQTEIHLLLLGGDQDCKGEGQTDGERNLSNRWSSEKGIFLGSRNFWSLNLLLCMLHFFFNLTTQVRRLSNIYCTLPCLLRQNIWNITSSSLDDSGSML